MSQSSVLQLLKKHPDRWFTVKQIAKSLNQNQPSINNNLRKLKHWNLIEYDRQFRGLMKYKHKK